MSILLRILSGSDADLTSTNYLLRIFMYFVVMFTTWTLAIFGFLAMDSKYFRACLTWAGGLVSGVFFQRSKFFSQDWSTRQEKQKSWKFWKQQRQLYLEWKCAWDSINFGIASWSMLFSTFQAVSGCVICRVSACWMWNSSRPSWTMSWLLWTWDPDRDHWQWQSWQVVRIQVSSCSIDVRIW